MAAVPRKATVDVVLMMLMSEKLAVYQ